MLGWETLPRHHLNLTAPNGQSMNWGWQRCRKAFLKKVGKQCACCGAKKKIEVHHKLPRHIRPDLALDHKNLIALCGGGKGCHFHIGHLNSYFNYNEKILEVAMYVYKHSIRKLNKVDND